MNSETSSRQADAAPMERHAHWLLRFALAGVFLFMGIDKFMAGGIEVFSRLMQLPFLVGGAVAIAEISGGLLILAGGALANPLGGLVTRLAALLMIPVLLGAIFREHWGQWHFMSTPSHPLGGMMFQVTLLLLVVYLLAKGNKA
jgi:putative oxidoreductase